MIERGELRLPDMQRRYVWRSTGIKLAVYYYDSTTEV
jgi:hypothetical protein